MKFCDCSDVYILFKGTITIQITGTVSALNNRNKKVIFKNCTPFTECVIEINNKDVDHVRTLIMPMLMVNW